MLSDSFKTAVNIAAICVNIAAILVCYFNRITTKYLAWFIMFN